MRIGDKVVDRWYSFHPDPKNNLGIGKIVSFSKGKRRIKIKFKKTTWIYDLAHFNQFVKKYKKGMEKFRQLGKVIPK